MADTLRLPNLPVDDHPATHREKQLHDAIVQFMRDVERDRFRLLTIVIGGKTKWRRVASSIWRGLRIGEDHQILDAMFSYFELQACAPRYQRRLLEAQHNVDRWRAIMREAMPDIELQREAVRRLENGWRE